MAELEGLVVQLKRERLLEELAVGGPGYPAAADGGRTATAPPAPLVVLGQAYRRVMKCFPRVSSGALQLANCLFVCFS